MKKEFGGGYNLNLTNDVLFRNLFGAKRNKKILLSLINAILPEAKLPLIRDIKIANPILEISAVREKEPVLDIRAVDEKGYMYNIEMQLGKDPDYKKRAITYLTKMHSSQLQSGEDYHTAKPCIGIHFLDFVLPDTTNHFFNYYGFVNLKETCKLHSDDLYLVYIELPKIDFSHKNKFNLLLKWIYFMLNVNKEEDKMIDTIRKEVPEIDQAAFEYQKLMAHHSIQHIIQAREMAAHDYTTRINRAIREGMEQGLEQGLEQGKAEGKAEIGRNLKNKGFSPTEIAELTDLSIEEVEKL